MEHLFLSLYGYRYAIVTLMTGPQNLINIWWLWSPYNLFYYYFL